MHMINEKRKTNNIKIWGMAVMCFAVVTALCSVEVKAEDHYLHDEYISVDGNEAHPVRAVDCEYENNEYISLKDMAELLKDTSAKFDVTITKDAIEIKTGVAYSEGAEGTSNKTADDSVDSDTNDNKKEISDGGNHRVLSGWQDTERENFSAGQVAANSLSVDGNLKKYYNLRAAYEDEGVDCFIRPLNLCMLLNINLVDTGNDSYSLDTGSVFSVSPSELEKDGYFHEVNTVLVGDASTGEIFYEYKGDEAFPIASVTKLMTYLLTEEAIAKGDFTKDDLVTVSKEAAMLSRSADGETPMKEGQQISVRELINGALLPSSNECAFLLAEKVSGDKDSFVELMNRRAEELSMTTAHFYNPNGLPDYSDSAIPAKRQNVMSAEDLFKLSSYIVNNFPQVKEVTDMTEAALKEIGLDVKNTNALLYNMPEVNGLKTGTTDRAGACLVTSLTVNDSNMDHDLIVILLGGENTRVRFTTSELMAYYAKNVVLKNLTAEGTVNIDENGEPQIKKVTSSYIVDMVIKEAMKSRINS